MLPYRLHLFDTNGDIRHTLELDGRDDQRAIVMVDRLSSSYAMELWHEDRLLKRYERAFSTLVAWPEMPRA